MEWTDVAKRRYRMGARAEATAATRRSIADAWIALFRELHYDEITLDLVAARAGVTVQTVIRHFGSKDELFATVTHRGRRQRGGAESDPPVGDPAAAIPS